MNLVLLDWYSNLQIKEMSLSTNQEKSEMTKKTWKVEDDSGEEPTPLKGGPVDNSTLVVELGPMEICTFLLKFEGVFVWDIIFNFWFNWTLQQYLTAIYFCLYNPWSSDFSVQFYLLVGTYIGEEKRPRLNWTRIYICLKNFENRVGIWYHAWRMLVLESSKSWSWSYLWFRTRAVFFLKL